MKPIVISLVAAALLIGGAVWFGARDTNSAPAADGANVSTENGVQVIAIDAKGGYSPRVSYAKAGVPTTIKLRTRGTFDCSSFVVIPSIGFRDALPQSGERDIALTSQKSGTILQGFCGMGMYNFQIHFN